MSKRTWMKVTFTPNYVVAYWLGIEHDSIVASIFCSGPDHFDVSGLVGSRADDTLSLLRLNGAKIEGPFDEPE
jgi:hypothetical protein